MQMLVWKILIQRSRAKNTRYGQLLAKPGNGIVKYNVMSARKKGYVKRAKEREKIDGER